MVDFCEYSKLTIHEWAQIVFQKPVTLTCGRAWDLQLHGAPELPSHCSHVSLWLLTARQPMHSVPAAGASGRSSARALRKGIEVIWDGGHQQMENCGSILAGEERAEVTVLCQILCGWLPWPRDDFHCKGRLTLVASVFGRKTSPDISPTLSWRGPARMCSVSLFQEVFSYLESLFQNQKCLDKKKWRVKLNVYKSRWNVKAWIILYEERENGILI